MLVQNLGGFLECRALRYRDQILTGHDLTHWPVGIPHETQIAVGQDPDQLPAFGDGHTADPIVAHQGQCFIDALVRTQGDRLGYHARFGAFDPFDLARLQFRFHVLVHHAHTTGPRQGNGHFRLGNRIHGCREEGDLQTDRLGQLGRRVDRGRDDLRVAGNQQHVIEGQSLTKCPAAVFVLHAHAA